MQNMLSYNVEKWKKWADNNKDFDCAVNKEDLSVRMVSNTASLSVLSQKTELDEKKMYELSADVYIENGESNVSALLSMTFKDANGNWKGHCDTPAVTKKGEWVHISKRLFGVVQPNVNCSLYIRGNNGDVKFKNIILTEFENNASADAEHINKKLFVFETPNKNPLMGFGAECDPKFFEDYNLSLMDDPEKEFAFLEKRMKEMNLPFVRVMLLPSAYEMEKGNITLDSKECRNLIRHLDLFERLHIDVVLTWWCVPREEMPWLSFSAKRPWCSPPLDKEYAAESLATFLDMLIKRYHYTCIKDIVLINEPNESYLTDKGIDFDHYAGFCRAFDNSLRVHNLRDKFNIIGSDDTSGFEWYKQCVTTLDNIFDGYDSHVYRWNVYDEKIDEEIQEFVKSRTKLTDKRFFVGEFGSETACSKQESAAPHKGLFVAALAINSVKAGASGISYWTLFEIYYGKSLMGMGLWKFYSENWAPKPIALVWRMLSKYTDRGDMVYPVDNDSMIDAVVFKSETGKTTVAILNRSFSTVNLEIPNIEFKSVPTGLLYDKNNVKLDQYIPDNFDFSYDGKLNCTVKPESFVIITDRT